MTKTFILTEDHIKLLQRLTVQWNDGEFGAPTVDCKRPYGNSGLVEDVCEILGWDDVSKVSEEDEEEFYESDKYEKLYMKVEKLHRETEIALQIVLHEKSFKPGLFTKVDLWSERWVREQL